MAGIRAMEENNGVKFQDGLGDSNALEEAAKMLRKLERTWDEYIRYGE